MEHRGQVFPNPPSCHFLGGVCRYLCQDWVSISLSWAQCCFFPLPQAKVEMLDNLLDIEVAYSLLRAGSDDTSKDPIDVNYEKLKTDIKVTGPTHTSP